MKNSLDSGVYGQAPVAPPAEFADRVRRLRDRMEEAGLDVLVLTSRDNFEYFTSHRTLVWPLQPRPEFMVIGRSEAVIVAPQYDMTLIASGNTQCDAQSYKGFLPEAADTVVSVCRSLAGASPTIGVDYGDEHYGRGSLALIEGLAKLGAVVEAGSVIWDVRAIKSEFEVGLIRATFDIMNRAFDDIVKSARVGMSEYDMFQKLYVELIRRGADRIDPFSVLFGKTGFQYSRLSSDQRLLEEGNYVFTDFRSSYGGYPADRNRIARVGQPTPVERDLYSTVRQATIEFGEGIQAGSTCADAHQVFRRAWKAAGLGDVVDFGRVGHGGGLGLTEPPSIARDSNEIIKPGMVLHIEPKLEDEHGVFQFEEIVLIGENGNEFLSELGPEEVPVIEP